MVSLCSPFYFDNCLRCGGFCIREKFFPKAPAMERPERDEIICVSIFSYSNTMGIAVDVDAGNWDDLLVLIDNSTPTRLQSVSDHPAVRPYYEVRLKTDSREYWYFIYEDGKQVYIEIPYVGIYLADNELLDYVISYFEE